MYLTNHYTDHQILRGIGADIKGDEASVSFIQLHHIAPEVQNRQRDNHKKT